MTVTVRVIYFFMVGLSICWRDVCDGMLARMRLIVLLSVEGPGGESPTYNKYSGMRSLWLE